MAGYKNWEREYRIAAGKAGSEGFEIGEKSESQAIPLHIDFSFQKSDLETQNTGKLTIWNLNKEHLSILNSKDCVLSFRAGYNNNIKLIFAGIISIVSTSIDGADQKTEIEVIDNLVEVRDTYISVSYKGTVSWKKIFDDTAAQMGVAISYSYNATFKDVSNGFSFVGPAKNILSKGCSCCGLSWSIQNGVLQIKRPDDVMSKEVYLLNSESGLIGIPVKVAVSEENKNKAKHGWDVEYFLNGAININDYIRLESDVVQGYFRVYSLEMQGDNLSGDWICKARLLEVE